MITGRSYKEFSDNVYNIEWDKKKYRVGEEFSVLEKKFKILALEDNQENGMQAMAVAPINSAGEINTIINIRNEPKALFFLSRNMI